MCIDQSPPNKPPRLDRRLTPVIVLLDDDEVADLEYLCHEVAHDLGHPVSPSDMIGGLLCWAAAERASSTSFTTQELN